MKLQKTSYDHTYYQTWLEKRPLRNHELEIKEKLVSYYKKTGSLLEIGCGEGELMYLLKNTYTVAGFDISSYAVEATNKRFKRKVAWIQDIEKTRISGKYDIILAFDILEHLSNPERALKMIVSSLNKNGILIFTVPNNYGLFGTVITHIFNFLDKTHISTFKRDKWIKLVRESDNEYVVLNHLWIGFSKAEWTKHIAFNLTIVIKSNGKN